MKHYLRQAYKTELRINSKLEQLEALRALAEKTTTTLELTPKGQGGSKTTENIVTKMVDLEREIESDIEGLLNVKADVRNAIKMVDEPELRLLLELRYLCYHSWGDIARAMGYDDKYVHKLHSKALLSLEEKHDTKRHQKTLFGCDMVRVEKKQKTHDHRLC